MSDSCKNCPSYLTADQSVDVFFKSIGAPMCARYGKVLGAPGLAPVAENHLQEQIASDCDGFGKPRPKEPQGFLDTRVTLPANRALQTLKDEPSTDDDKLMVNSCRNCVFYAGENAVSETKGWYAGLCTASGRLIIPGRESREAKNCSMRKPGSQVHPDMVEDMHIIPMYAEAKAYDPSPLGRWKKARENGDAIDPNEYPTDALVTDTDRKSGIRAWRRVEDPNGSGNSTFLPIFDPEHFPESERATIPQTGDENHPEDYIDAEDYVYSVAVEWQEFDATPALWGPPSAGKTELARHIAWLMQAPFHRMSFTKSMEVDDLIGKWTFLGGETRFQWGRLPQAWVKPGILLMDEPNAGPDEVWQRIRPLTDNAKQLVLDEANAEIVQRNPFCFLMMAMNPAWDIRNIGTQELADADTDRLTHIFMELPPYEVEYEILKAACERDGWTPTRAQLDGVLENAKELRALVKDGSLPVSWGVRADLKVIRHLNWFTPEVAYRRAVADLLEPQARDLILDTIRTAGRL